MSSGVRQNLHTTTRHSRTSQTSCSPTGIATPTVETLEGPSSGMSYGDPKGALSSYHDAGSPGRANLNPPARYLVANLPKTPRKEIHDHLTGLILTGSQCVGIGFRHVVYRS